MFNNVSAVKKLELGKRIGADGWASTVTLKRASLMRRHLSSNICCIHGRRSRQKEEQVHSSVPHCWRLLKKQRESQQTCWLTSATTLLPRLKQDEGVSLFQSNTLFQKTNRKEGRKEGTNERRKGGKARRSGGRETVCDGSDGRRRNSASLDHKWPGTLILRGKIEQ